MDVDPAYTNLPSSLNTQKKLLLTAHLCTFMSHHETECVLLSSEQEVMM